MLEYLLILTLWTGETVYDTFHTEKVCLGDTPGHSLSWYQAQPCATNQGGCDDTITVRARSGDADGVYNDDAD